jgi:hypothetical protein
VTAGEWQATHDAWLVDRQALSSGQWAERRALWFQARDAWIASRREGTDALRPEGFEAPQRSAAGACAALVLAPRGERVSDLG